MQDDDDNTGPTPTTTTSALGIRCLSLSNNSQQVRECIHDQRPAACFCSGPPTKGRRSRGLAHSSGNGSTTTKTFHDHPRGKKHLEPRRSPGDRGGNIHNYGLPQKRDEHWSHIIQKAPNPGVTASQLRFGDLSPASPLIEHDIPPRTKGAGNPSYNALIPSTRDTPLAFGEKRLKKIASFTYGKRQYPGELQSTDCLRHPPPTHATMRNSDNDAYYRNTDKKLWYGNPADRDELNYTRPNFKEPTRVGQYEEDWQRTHYPKPGRDDFQTPMREHLGGSPKESEGGEDTEAAAAAPPPIVRSPAPSPTTQDAGPERSPDVVKSPRVSPPSSPPSPQVDSPSSPPPSPKESAPTSRANMSFGKSPLAPSPAEDGGYVRTVTSPASQITPPQEMPNKPSPAAAAKFSDAKSSLSSNAKATEGVKHYKRMASQVTPPEVMLPPSSPREEHPPPAAAPKEGVFKDISPADLLDPDRSAEARGLRLEGLSMEDAKREYKNFMKSMKNPMEVLSTNSNQPLSSTAVGEHMNTTHPANMNDIDYHEARFRDDSAEARELRRRVHRLPHHDFVRKNSGHLAYGRMETEDQVKAEALHEEKQHYPAHATRNFSSELQTTHHGDAKHTFAALAKPSTASNQHASTPSHEDEQQQPRDDEGEVAPHDYLRKSEGHLSSENAGRHVHSDATGFHAIDRKNSVVNNTGDAKSTFGAFAREEDAVQSPYSFAEHRANHSPETNEFLHAGEGHLSSDRLGEGEATAPPAADFSANFVANNTGDAKRTFSALARPANYSGTNSPARNLMRRENDDQEKTNARRLMTMDASSFFVDHGVYLNIYDMSHGYAKAVSPVLLGRRIQGIWHTGIEVFGREYFYGGGVYKIAPGGIAKNMGLVLHERRFMGTTSVSQDTFEEFLCELKPLFNEHTYNLLSWNCNHFADMLAQFLVGRGIGADIVGLGERIQRSFMGKCLAQCLMSFQPPTAGHC